MPTSQHRGVEGADGELAPRPGAPLIAVQAPEFDGRTFGLCLRLRLGENLQPRAPHAHQIKLRLGDPAGKLVTRRGQAPPPPPEPPLPRPRLDLPRQEQRPPPPPPHAAPAPPAGNRRPPPRAPAPRGAP